AGLPGLEVEPVDAAAVDDVGIERVGRDLVGFPARGDLMEMGDVDPVELAVAAARYRRRTRILLGAVDSVRVPVVGRDMVELAGRLVVPAAPGLPAVDRHQRPLVNSKNPTVGILR